MSYIEPDCFNSLAEWRDTLADAEAKAIMNEPMCENCGSGSHHTEECIYSFGANPQ